MILIFAYSFREFVYSLKFIQRHLDLRIKTLNVQERNAVVLTFAISLVHRIPVWHRISDKHCWIQSMNQFKKFLSLFIVNSNSASVCLAHLHTTVLYVLIVVAYLLHMRSLFICLHALFNLILTSLQLYQSYIQTLEKYWTQSEKNLSDEKNEIYGFNNANVFKHLLCSMQTCKHFTYIILN